METSKRGTAPRTSCDSAPIDHLNSSLPNVWDATRASLLAGGCKQRAKCASLRECYRLVLSGCLIGRGPRITLKIGTRCHKKNHEVCSVGQISKLGSNAARQDVKSLLRRTLEEFHFLCALQRSSSFAVIILGVVVEEEVTCLGNIGPPSAGSGVCVCWEGASGNITWIYGNIILPCRTFKIRRLEVINFVFLLQKRFLSVCLSVWLHSIRSLTLPSPPTTLDNRNLSPYKHRCRPSLTGSRGLLAGRGFSSSLSVTVAALSC